VDGRFAGLKWRMLIRVLVVPCIVCIGLTHCTPTLFLHHQSLPRKLPSASLACAGLNKDLDTAPLPRIACCNSCLHPSFHLSYVPWPSLFIHPRYYDLHDVCKTVRGQSPRTEVFRSALINAGYRWVDGGPAVCPWVGLVSEGAWP